MRFVNLAKVFGNPHNQMPLIVRCAVTDWVMCDSEPTGARMRVISPCVEGNFAFDEQFVGEETR